MSDDTARDEAESIVRALAEILPEEITGQNAITAMHAGDSTQWRQMEWIGFWLEWIFENQVSPRIGGAIGPDFGRTRFDFRLKHVWDLKVHVNSVNEMILNDCDAVDQCIALHGGLGFIVVSGDTTMDDDGSFKSWHDAFKGKPSAYVLSGRAKGRRSRPRKSAFNPTSVAAIRFSSLEELRSATSAGWMKDTFQKGMTNSGGSARRAKYSLMYDSLPDESILAWTDL